VTSSSRPGTVGRGTGATETSSSVSRSDFIAGFGSLVIAYPPPIVSEGGVFGTGNASDTVAKNYKEEEKKKVMEAGEGGADISLLPFARWIDRIPSCHDDVEDDTVELV
jgi:hypothetical protein